VNAVFLVHIWLCCLLAGATPVRADNRVVGHGEAADLARQQWSNSAHAGSLDSPEERERMNRTGCAHCHTAQGYWEVILAGQKSTAPYAEVMGLTCEACHQDNGGRTGDETADVGPLRAGAPRDICFGCHDIMVANDPDYLSWCSQGLVVAASGGHRFSGWEQQPAAHENIERRCVTCHMAPAAAGVDRTLVGGHTFRVKTKGRQSAVFNPGGCLGCHESMNPEFVAASQQEVRDLLENLAGVLPQKPVPADSTRTEPRYPADPTLSEIEVHAAFNYWMIQKDGSFGVHNPLYTRQLLKRTLAALQVHLVD